MGRYLFTATNDSNKLEHLPAAVPVEIGHEIYLPSNHQPIFFISEMILSYIYIHIDISLSYICVYIYRHTHTSCRLFFV